MYFPEIIKLQFAINVMHCYLLIFIFILELLPLNRGRQWETASLILCLCWAACANACGIEVGGYFVSLSRKFTSF